MRNKRLLRTLSVLCLTLVLVSGFTVPAFAQGAAPPPAEDTTNDSNVVEETEKAPPLTPDGNAALVDDFGGNKQLITVTTKAGNYFYILIDRANEDKKTAVHFLNQVDEADLMALMEDGKAKEEPPAVCSCTKKCEAGSVILAEPLDLSKEGYLRLTEEEGLNFVGGFSTLAQFLQEQKKDRHTEEVEAESISYAVCKYFKIETGENSFGYIASWSQGKELKELRASLETINKTSGTLISDIERHYKEICKERGIDPNAKAEPETAPIEQPADAAKVSDRQPTGNLTYYAAECMEFPNLGEYHDNLSLEEAIRIYQEIPAERMNGIKGIGFELKDGSDYEGPFPILTGQTIDLDTIQAIDYYRDNPLVQKAVKDLAEAMPEMEVLGADANQQEALFLIDGATYLHIWS